MLLSSAFGAWAQKRIKAIDITIEQPEVGTPIWNGEAQAAIKVKSIITDAFGSQNMLGGVANVNSMRRLICGFLTSEQQSRNKNQGDPSQ